MSDPVVFIDTETTGLDVELHRVWEIALITSDDAYLLQPNHVEVSHADPKALELNGFYERYHGYAEPEPPTKVMHTDDILNLIEHETAGKHLVGSNPAFDEERLRRMFRQRGKLPRWHHRMVDVRQLAVGYLQGRGIPIKPPWKTAEINDALGVGVPEELQHTAMGDARWAELVYRTVMG